MLKWKKNEVAFALSGSFYNNDVKIIKNDGEYENDRSHTICHCKLM